LVSVAVAALLITFRGFAAVRAVEGITEARALACKETREVTAFPLPSAAVVVERVPQAQQRTQAMESLQVSPGRA
jgi:hypothetical protein